MLTGWLTQARWSVLGPQPTGEPRTTADRSVLAPLGTAEELAGDTGKGRNSALVENVGYGIQSVQPKPMDVETRYKSTSAT
jgi:hypothetical protein